MIRARAQALIALPLTIVHRLGLYAVNVLLVTAVGVFTIPVLVRAVGPEQWAHFAVLQTLAQIALIVVMYGWGVVGPSFIAAAPRDRRPALYAESLEARLVLYVAAIPVAGLIGTLLLGREHAPLAFAAAVVLLLPGLSAGWYFVGTARPDRLLLLDSCPLVVMSILGLIGAGVLGALWPYLVGLGLGSAASAAISATVVLRGARRDHRRDRSFPARLRAALAGQRHAVVATLVNTLYVSAPTLVIQILMPSRLPVYALMDRLYRYGSVAYGPVQQYLQGWIPDTDGDVRARNRRMVLAVRSALGIGLAGCVVLTAAGPVVARLFSHGTIEVRALDLLPLGVAFAAVCTSMTIGYACLSLLGKVKLVAVSTMVGAVVGLPLIVVAAALGDSVRPVAWALALSEIAVATVQGVVLWRHLRHDRFDTVPR